MHPPSAWPRHAVAGAAVVLGWVLHDLAVFTTHGWPYDARHLLPASLALVAGGALAGAASAAWPRAGVGALLVFGGVAIAGAVFEIGQSVLPAATRLLPRALIVLLLAGAACTALARRGWSPARAGLALGVIACVLFTAHLQRLPRVSPWMLGAAVVALAAGALPRRGARWIVTALAAAAPLPRIAERVDWFLTPARGELPPPGTPADPAAPNLVLVVLDALRADRLAPYGYERATTPALDAFVRESMTLHAQARSTSSWTLPSHASLLTGLLPAQHGVTHPLDREHEAALSAFGMHAYALRPGTSTLAGRLRDAGYDTAAILSNSAALRVEYGLEGGFARYDALPACYVRGYLALSQLAGGALWVGHKPYRDAETITDLALAWLARRSDRPFFLFLNYMEPHWPYLPPPPFDRAFGGRPARDPLAPSREEESLQHDRELLYLDAHLMRLIDALRSSGLLESTMLVITSDHGEGFGEHGVWKHDWTLYEELIRVPLYVLPPGGRQRAVDPEPIHGAELHDLMARAMGLETRAAGENAPDAEWYYLSDLPLPEGLDPERSRRHLLAWIEDGVKTIVSSRDDVEVYDLTADPDEASPLELSPRDLEARRRRARNWWEARPEPVPAKPRLGKHVVLEDPAARLRALGYAGDE